jgi:hypothetical protein
LDYQNFSESDLGLMLIELVSYMGSVFSLKGDMLANENYLRTVKTRENLKKLLELIGVDMRGPLSAAAAARLTANTTPPEEDFPLLVTPSSRVFSIISKEDGAPVNYTLYKIVNNTISDITSPNATFELKGDEADNAASSVFTNVAILEGAMSVQKGTFDTLEGNKRIALTDSPIIEGSVQVFISTGNKEDESNGAYRQVERLFAASGINDRVFQVIYGDNYTATLLFGDGVTGISPPAGATFTIVYRVGGGSRGNIIGGAINITTTVESSDGNTFHPFITENITPATGGQDAETAEHAKKYAPLTFKRQDRVVTLEDYIAIGNTFRSKQGTVGKTTAAVRDAFSSANVIDVYTLEKASDHTLQKASTTFKKDLLEEIEPKKMLTDEVVVVDGLIRTLDLVVTIRIDEELEPIAGTIQQEVAEIIMNFFNVDNFDFGKPFITSELNRDIFNLDKVRYATVDNLPEVTNVDFHEIIQLNNFTINTITV